MIAMSDKGKAKKADTKAKRDGETRRPRVMRLGEKVEALMALRSLSAADVSRRTGIHATRISEWGRGEGAGSQTPLVFLKLAKALEVTADFLLDDTQDTFRPAVDPEEKKILELAREMGYQVALRRLLQLNDTAEKRQPTPGATTGRPPAPHDAPGSRETG
jgi:transcriptional regulator with XRE-family HTH domain